MSHPVPRTSNRLTAFAAAASILVLLMAWRAFGEPSTRPDAALAECQLENNRLRVEVRDLKAEIATRQKMYADALETYVDRIAELQGRLARALAALTERPTEP